MLQSRILFSCLLSAIVKLDSIQFNSENGTVVIENEADWDTYILTTENENLVTNLNKNPQLHTIRVINDVKKMPQYSPGFQYIKKYIIDSQVDSFEFGLFFNKAVEEIILNENIKSISGLTGSSISKINLDNVKIIQDDAFQYCKNLLKVNLSSVEEINKNAFKFSGLSGEIDIPGLKRLGISIEEINSKIIIIEWYGLCGCTQLKNITGVITELDVFGFKDCLSLTSIDLSNISFIEKGAFMGCKNLVSVKLSPSLEGVDDKAFVGCENLVLTEISFSSKMCFTNCLSIKNVTFTGESISERTFFNCIGLEIFTATKNIDIIPNGCFQNCINLVSVSLPFEVELGEYAFCNTSIESLDGIKIRKLGSYCFAHTPLKEGFIFRNNENNSNIAFYKCPHLTTITIIYPNEYNSQSQTELDEEIQHGFGCVAECPLFAKYVVNRDDDLFFEGGVLYNNKSKTIIYSVVSVGLSETFVIPETVKKILISSFTSSVSCKRITVKHDNLQLVSPSYLYGIEELIFEPSEQSYKIYIDFHFICTSLVTIRLNGFAKLFNKNIILDRNQKLENLYLHESILHNCLYFEVDGSPKLKNIDLSELGKSLQQESSYALYGSGGELRWTTLNKSVLEIIFPENIDPLSVESITIPENIIIIGDNVFEKFKNTKKVNLPTNIENIGDSAFAGTKIEEIKLPSSIRTIGKRVFRHCPLKKVSLEGGENHKYLKIIDNQLIERNTGRLILTFGELPKRMRLSDEIKYVDSFSLKSLLLKNYKAGRVENKGIETLIVPESVEIMEYGFISDSSQISSICFEGKLPMTISYNSEKYQYDLSKILDKEIPVINPKLYSEKYTGWIEYYRISEHRLGYPISINNRECADDSFDKLDINIPNYYPFLKAYVNNVSKYISALGLGLLILCIILLIAIIILVIFIVLSHQKNKEESDECELGETADKSQEPTRDNPLRIESSSDETIHYHSSDDHSDSDN